AHDSGGTTNGGVDTSPTQTFTITLTLVNHPPSFVKGANQAVLEDAGAKTINGWATAISPGPPTESAQNVTFTTSNDNNSLFSQQPALSSSGTLTFTPAANANGSALVTVAAQDNGGTANGGNDTSAPQTFTITVTAVNDAPSFTKGSDQTAADSGGATSVAGWATGITAGPPDESTQSVTFNVTATTTTLFSVQPAVAPDGTLTFTPQPGMHGTTVVNVTASDNGGTANGGVDTSAAQTFSITVNGTPNASPDSFSGTENTDIDGNVLANDTDPQGATLTTDTSAVSGPSNGSVIIDNDGSFSYAPAAGFSGSDAFTYRVTNSL